LCPPGGGQVTLIKNSNGYIFAGAQGGCVYRSTDYGESWTQISHGFANDSQVITLAINPYGHIFAGTNSDGIYRSTDNGNSWCNMGLPYRYISSLAINTNGHIYLGTIGYHVYRSIDNGENWSKINTGLLHQAVYTFAFNSNGYIFIGTGGGGVYKSTKTTTGAERNVAFADKFLLHQNYPNPFNPSTIIEYQIPERCNVVLKVYDLLGKLICILVNEEKTAGSYSVSFNSRNLSNGVYFYHLQAGEYSSTSKMILLK